MNLSATLISNLDILAAISRRGGSGSGSVSAAGADSGFQMLTHWPGQRDLLSMAQAMGPGIAALLIVAGLFYLLFGITWFRALVVLNAAGVGAILGGGLGAQGGAAIPGAVVGAVLAGVITWPLMKWAVAVMGATSGALLAATIWRVAGLDPAFTWAGALTGLVAGCLMCFIIFRGCVMAYTSLQGSVMVIFGVLGLLFMYRDLGPKAAKYLAVKPYFLPLCVFIPTIIGIMYQQYTAAPAEAGGGGGGDGGKGGGGKK
jgi:hypothetical protein